VDYSGRQYWSDVVNVIPNEKTLVQMNLEQLALNKTNDPKPVRFDGIPPVSKPEPIQVATIGSLMGILSQAAVANSGTEKVYYYLNDHLGTPQLLMDANAAVTWKATYKPFGEAMIEPASTSTNNLRFPGQYFDQETGFYYNYHRYYDPAKGRYLTSDPLRVLGEIQLFAYVRNNPTNLVDPFGLKEFEMVEWIGGSVGHAVFGGGVYDVTIRDLKTGETTLYTMWVFGVGVSFPSLRGSSIPLRFEVEDACATSDSFEGYGYLGGASVEVITGLKMGGGIKIPNGPFIPGAIISPERGGFDIGVSHNITYWSR
jgi:RHS repeat-associated protein